LIEAEKATYTVTWMCRMLNVARSSFYAWRARVATPTRARRRELAIEIRRSSTTRARPRAVGGSGPRSTARGRECSVGLVADLMRELDLRAVQPRAYKRTTVPGEDPVASPDLIGRDFDPASSAPGERLVGDITYRRTGEGWLYLATVIDLATRRWWAGSSRRTCAPASSSTPCRWASTPAWCSPTRSSTAIEAQDPLSECSAISATERRPAHRRDVRGGRPGALLGVTGRPVRASRARGGVGRRR
jgi:hypothetical protein